MNNYSIQESLVGSGSIMLWLMHLPNVQSFRKGIFCLKEEKRPNQTSSVVTPYEHRSNQRSFQESTKQVIRLTRMSAWMRHNLSNLSQQTGRRSSVYFRDILPVSSALASDCSDRIIANKANVISLCVPSAPLWPGHMINQTQLPAVTLYISTAAAASKVSQGPVVWLLCYQFNCTRIVPVQAPRWTDGSTGRGYGLIFTVIFPPLMFRL